MKNPFNILLFVVLMFLSAPSIAQKKEIIHLDQLLALLKNESDSVLVVNFWATWCKPCVAEMPSFIKVEQEFENEKIRFVYLSLDFRRDFSTRLLPYVEKMKMKGDVFLLNELDYDAWIDLVEPGWQGSLPSTLVISPQSKTRTFHEGELSHDELKNLIKSYLPWNY